MLQFFTKGLAIAAIIVGLLALFNPQALGDMVVSTFIAVLFVVVGFIVAAFF